MLWLRFGRGAGVEGVEHGFQFEADLFELLDGFYFAGYAGVVVAYLLLGGFEFHSFFFYEESYETYFFNVGRCVKACSALIAVWFYDSKFMLPEAQGGGGETYHLRDFSYLVIFFGKIIHYRV